MIILERVLVPMYTNCDLSTCEPIWKLLKEKEPIFYDLVQKGRQALDNLLNLGLSDLGRVIDANEDVRNFGVVNGNPMVQIQISRQPNANIIDTVARIKAID